MRPFFPTPTIINGTTGMRRKMPTAMVVSGFRVNGGTAINITGYNAEKDCSLPAERLRYSVLFASLLKNFFKVENRNIPIL